MKEPRGGTELQIELLEKYVGKEILNQVQITVSVPEKIPLSKNKPNILWQHNSYDQPNLAPWFKDKANHKKYDWYVFNSHWCFEKFRYNFDIPAEKCVVIKNGVEQITPRPAYKKGDPIKLIFHPTPWRGLNVMLAAMQMVKNPLIHLDVYSSCEIYGQAFKEANDKQYQSLYDQAKQLKNVTYIGYKPNEYIREHLKDYHMFVYPNVWEETFCLTALEAMAAGLYTMVTNHGALFETCAEYAAYIPFEKDFVRLAQKTAFMIENAAVSLHEPEIEEHMKLQIEYVNRFYKWEKKAHTWTQFLKGAIKNAGPK
jgi:glycosyltransferase involved in cell wall biosynthesis